MLGILLTTFLGGILSIASTAPTEKQQDSARGVATTVKYSHGTVVGSSSNGIDSFKGIPFAQPPVGDLRLRKPLHISKSRAVINGTATPNKCPQMVGGSNITTVPKSTLDIITRSPSGGGLESEDCLTLNIYRPAGTTKKIPVVFWIYGGGFQTGSTSAYDPTSLLLASVKKNKPLIFVAANYRLNGFGFLPGKQVVKEGVANLGLLDQRLALQWVAENIGRFGGDAHRVTIWGESAGSISVLSQLTLYNGNNVYKGRRLFRAAVMNSGSIVPSEPTGGLKGENVFQNFAKLAGCGDTSADKVLACLRKVNYTTYHTAAVSFPTDLSYQALNLPYTPRPDGTALTDSAEILIAKGHYAQVPMIIGDQVDVSLDLNKHSKITFTETQFKEGTLFSLAQTNITTTAQLIDYFATFYFPTSSRANIANFISAYPDDPSQGSPFKTGTLNNIYPQYKRLSAILGDYAFSLSRRRFLKLAKAISPKVPAWSYIATYFHGLSVLGTFHSTDVIEIFGTTQAIYSSNSTSSGSTNPRFAVDSIFEYYINFFTGMDPNCGLGDFPPFKAGLSPAWPQWDVVGEKSFEFGSVSNNVTRDDFRTRQYEALVRVGAGAGLKI